MGISFRKKVLVGEEKVMFCEKCKKVLPLDHNFCSDCGSKTISQSTKVYANYGKSGLTSISYKMPNGLTYNTRTGLSKSLGNGITLNSK